MPNPAPSRGAKSSFCAEERRGSPRRGALPARRRAPIETMAQGARPERLGDLIRAEMADLLVREVKDPGIGFLTVTAVRVTVDLQLARVYYTAWGDRAARQATARALTRVAPFLRRLLGRRLRLKRIPRLEFVYDESIEGQDRIERLIQQIHEEAAAHAPTGTGSDEHPGDHRDEDEDDHERSGT